MLESCICVDTSDGDPAELCTAKMVKARKTHHCDECGKEILPGMLYERAQGKSDGYFWSHKTCEICARVRDSLFKCGYIYGEIWSAVAEEYGEECCPHIAAQSATPPVSVPPPERLSFED